MSQEKNKRNFRKVSHFNCTWLGMWLFPGQLYSFSEPHIFPLNPYLSRLLTKPTKWHVRPARSAQFDRVFAVRMKKAWILKYSLSAQRRLWSDWADLSSLGAHTILLVCHSTAHLSLIFPVQALRWTFRYVTEFITSWTATFEWQLTTLLACEINTDS